MNRELLQQCILQSWEIKVIQVKVGDEEGAWLSTLVLLRLARQLSRIY